MKLIKKHISYFFIFVIWLLFIGSFFLKGNIPFPSTYLVSFFPPWSAYYGMPVKNNAMPDIITQIFPWKHLTIDVWKTNQVPLWNPYSFSGSFHAGNYQTAVFSPFNILFLFLPFVDAWSLLIFLQPLIAGISMSFFVKSVGKSEYAQIVASLAFMFCGFLTTWMGYGTLGLAIAFLPSALGAVVHYEKRKKWWVFLVIAGSIYLSFSSGHYQISFYFLSVVALFVSFMIRTWRDRFLLWGICLLGLGLALPQILVTLHAFLLSNRSESFITKGFIPWNYLVTLFSPDFYGNPVTRNDWFGQYAEWSSYVGVIPLFFSVYAIVSKRERYKKFFLALFFFSLIIAMQTPINSLIYWLKIPILSTSVATRAIVLGSFALAFLAGCGIDDLIADWKGKGKSLKKVIFICSIFIAFFWIVLLAFHPLPEQYLMIAKRNSLISSCLIMMAVGLSILGFRFNKLKIFILIFFILLTTTDLFRFANKWMPRDPKQFVYPLMPSISYLQKNVATDRVYGTFGNELNTYFQIPSIEGYDAMYQKRYGEFISTSHDGKIGALERSVVHLDKSGKYSEDILKFLGVRYIFHRISDGRNIWAYPFWNYDYYQKKYEDSGYEIYENLQSFPRAFLASSYVIKTDKQEIIDTLFSKDFSRRDTLVLESKPVKEPKEGEGTVKIIKYEPNSILMESSSSVPKLLFLSDVYDAGWHAYVNGESTPILRADYAFRAISVPAGKYNIEFKYEPREFYLGVLGSLISFFVLTGISMRRLHYENRNLHTIS